jgi:hypothetical protein
MAVVTVTSNNNRIEDCEVATGFANIGGGAGGAAEAPFAYQGNLLYNRKVTSATGAGFEYVYSNDGGTALDMTTTDRRVWMVKATVSDYGGLDATDGLLVRIGTNGTNYYAYVIAGSDSPASNFGAYRDVGGLLVVPVDPNVNATYNDTVKDAGTPTLTSIDYFGLVAAFTTSSAKNENVGLDAIDIGSGLYLVGGDGADPDATYQSFADFDGNTVNNRFGYARNTDGGGLLGLGTWILGANSGGAVATVLVDNDSVITWLDHLADVGFNGVEVNLGNATTAITDGALHIGAGNTTNIDSRPDYTIVGVNSGTLTLQGTLRNFRNVSLGTGATVTGQIECKNLQSKGATITGATILCDEATQVATHTDFAAADVDDTDYIQSGAGHAIEIKTAGTYSLDNLRFSGFGADGANDASVFVSAGSGTVTLNIVNGGDTPTFRTAGATVVINNTVTLKVTVKDAVSLAAIQNARVLLLAGDVGPENYQESVSIVESGGTATVTLASHGYATNDKVLIEGVTGTSQEDMNGIKEITGTTANTFTYFTTIGQGTATGTPIATTVLLDANTDASGVVQDTGYGFLSNQDVSGRVRKGTTSPFYKTSGLTGTITSAGYDVTSLLISDE